MAPRHLVLRRSRRRHHRSGALLLRRRRTRALRPSTPDRRSGSRSACGPACTSPPSPTPCGKRDPRCSRRSAPPPPESELVPRSPARSRTSIFYKFSSDYVLREQYRNPWNEIRMGRLVEDLDALAGTICYKHCSSDDGTTRPLLPVTASVDRMVLKRPIRIDTDLQIEGAVTWVGRSSMEIQLEVTQSTEETQDSSDSALTASFTFVARDSRTGKSAPVKPISPVTDREKLLWEEAEKRNKMRKKKREERNKYGNVDDLSRLQALLAEGRVFCDMPALADRDSILIKRYLF